ncbi:MAG: class I SAM-dependent methyltransferase [Bacteroidales bacterium]|nr:class I SAM-dependent methyltransferase [Bacteroidales bacterium]
MEKRMRTRISNFLRTFGLLLLTDKLRFFLIHLKTLKERSRFIKENPGIAIPPAYLIYESFDLNYDSYYFASRNTANWLLDHFKRHYNLINVNILDWGCGPARIVRHLPDFLDKSCAVYGTDYNPESIAWNKKSIKGVNFNLNYAEPPLPYVNNSFDIIYGISIFTHLPEDLHYKWFDELVRISKNNGIIFLTLQGEAFRVKLTELEMQKFDKGELITRGNTKIGHRTYSAIHPPGFVKGMIKGHQLLEHIEGDIRNNKPQQDIWIIKVVK